jgi:GrpB-like predicted nucleotidyltransferase (UPF0157 family)/GNAT superfamily N-acetyltransferase
METLEERIRRVVQEDIAIVPYDPCWPEWFRREKEHLLSCLPGNLVRRVEHFGSTAVPGLAAKPIVDMLVEVTDLQAARTQIAPLLEAQGYDYFWRPTHGDDGPPFYAWFIKRDPASGVRTHHIHMVDAGFRDHWDRLHFRDYLIAHPHVALEYQSLKLHLASEHSNDRVAYTQGKTDFIVRVTEEARRLHAKPWTLRRLHALDDALIDQLASVLIDCVEGGASVSFMLPLTRERALAFWRRVAQGVAAGERALLVAEDAQGVCGTVHLVLDQPENQPHRADLVKMLVHRRARRQGLGAALVRAAENTARECGKTLLVLDAVTGGDAERLYQRLGWKRVGVIPAYALFPEGGLCDTTYYYRDLDGS